MPIEIQTTMPPANFKTFRNSVTTKFKRHSNNSHFKELLDSADNSSASTINEDPPTLPIPSKESTSRQSSFETRKSSAVAVTEGSESLSTAETKTSSTSALSHTAESTTALSSVSNPTTENAAPTAPPLNPVPPPTARPKTQPRPFFPLRATDPYTSEQSDTPTPTPTPKRTSHSRFSLPNPHPLPPPPYFPPPYTSRPHSYPLPPLPTPQPSPLTDLQFHCYTKHRDLLFLHQPRHPDGQVASCMICPMLNHPLQSQDREPGKEKQGQSRGKKEREERRERERWRCKWCYLYLCGLCKRKLGREYGGDLRKMVAESGSSKNGGGDEGKSLRPSSQVGKGDDTPERGNDWACFI